MRSAHRVEESEERRERAERIGTLGRGPGRSRRPLDLTASAAFVAGGALILWSAAIHFHLWHADGYRSIPTVGPLFLLQSLAGVVVGSGVVVVRRLWAALLGLVFAVLTLGAFLISVWRGLFGFQDTWLAPFAQEAFGIEVAAAAALGVAAVLCATAAPRATHPRARPRTGAPMPRR